MSKMIKESNVEDILFSIRRLVSEAPSEQLEAGKSKDVVTDPAMPVEAVEPLNAGALLLTSSLRVVDPEPKQTDLDEMTAGLSHFREAVTRDDTGEAEFLSLDEVFAVKPEGPRRLHLSDVVTNVAQKVDGDYFEDEDTGKLSDRKWAADLDTDTLKKFAGEEDVFGVSDQKDTDVEALEAGATDGLADFDANSFDDEAVRDMITQIVREELSGELGERITRNVRKLVRREIQRALTAREFD